MSLQERPKLIEIKEKLNLINRTDHREFLTCDLISEGVPRGVLCEITGSARTEFILTLLKQNPHLNTFWAEEHLTILPTAIHQRGVNLERILMAETGEMLFQSLRKALKSRLFDCVVLPGAIEEVKMLKALQLFARESNAYVFFLSKILKSVWAIPFQVETEWENGINSVVVKVVKSKFFQVKNK